MRKYRFLALCAAAILLSIVFVKVQQAKNDSSFYKTELSKGAWKTTQIIGLDTAEPQYILTRITERGFAGNLISFKDSTCFRSEKVSSCGNDYFTVLDGKYRILDNNKLGILVDSVSYWGEWEKPTEHRKPKLLFFVISKTGNSLILTKIK